MDIPNKTFSKKNYNLARKYLRRNEFDLYRLIVKSSPWKRVNLWILVSVVVVSFGLSMAIVFSVNPALGMNSLEEPSKNNDEVIDTNSQSIDVLILTSLFAVVVSFLVWNVLIKEFAIKEGKKLFNSWQSPIREVLCDQAELREKIENPSPTDSANLVMVIADIIATSQLKIPVPPILIGTLVVKIGVRNFCRCEELAN
ncbi:MAG: hypothetical protein HY862_09045 [Chloroflexi bacterium]|nr:hypothetical protein [Chloroflexota bacterium]